ncbi:protein fem-1 homolog B isoform X2 [Halyomorpha halys]|uniref:protein fem-1 homolog B isoform X2 n=1 Tax=Halyomorpha halys TaxID=286706 RepID=UPI0006D4FC65|nr:protein fem-1 homolog B isoform X2 [Halyomorpha halys]
MISDKIMGLHPVNPAFVKQIVFFASRDGMGKILCNTLIERPQSEMPELLEQEVYDYQGQCLTPLIAAARNGHNTVVKILLSKFNANIEHEGCVRVEHYFIEGATPLWCAAGAGHLNVVKTLVKAGADVNHTTTNNSTPMRAACYDGRLDIVKYLAMHGADINKPNKYNNTCLMIASYKGHIDIVRYLLERKVDPNEQAHCGATALFFAAECGHLEVVKDLLKYGARLIPTNHGITPVLAAAERTRADVVEYFIFKCKLTIEEQINAYELLGASFANDKDNYCPNKAYFYLLKGMKLRFSVPEAPIKKPVVTPIPAYENWIESQNVQELQARRNNNNAIHMESLAIRERILGKENPEVPHPIIYRGAVFADNGRFDRCIDLWIHALQLTQAKDSLVKDLRRFAQIFSQMVHDGIELQFSIVAYILTVAVKELERNKLQVEKAVLKDDVFQVKEDIESNVITALYLIVIISKLLTAQTMDEVFKIHQLVFRINELKLTARNGQSLLHLCVNADTPVDNFHTSNICRFPCAETTKLLIKCGADVNALDDDRNSPLHTIVLYQTRLSDFRTLHSIIKDLIDAGAHIDIVNNRGDTPLETAATGIAEIILRSQNKVSLKCLAARAIARHGIEYEEQVPSTLIDFIELHGPCKAASSENMCSHFCEI